MRVRGSDIERMLNHNDRWVYWVLLIMFIALAIILIRRNRHADYVYENGQITTCQVLHKYRLPANQNNGPAYKVIITFVWGTVKDTLDIQTKQADWETVLPGGIYEMRYLSNERISAQNCDVIFDKLLDVDSEYIENYSSSSWNRGKKIKDAGK